MELVVSVSVLAVLAASALPSYIGTQNDAKATMSQAHLITIKQAFTNYFFEGVLDGNGGVFPPIPVDNIMTETWAAETILYTGRNINSLFAEGMIPISPFGKPYKYEDIVETGTGNIGIRITDQTTTLSVDFLP